MEMKKLHMGTMSYGFDSMDEVAHQLSMTFGTDSKFMTQPSIGIDVLPVSNKTPTGIQMATRGRRDMSSRVRDAVLCLALCHNVSHFAPVA